MTVDQRWAFQAEVMHLPSDGSHPVLWTKDVSKVNQISEELECLVSLFSQMLAADSCSGISIGAIDRCINLRPHG